MGAVVLIRYRDCFEPPFPSFIRAEEREGDKEGVGERKRGSRKDKRGFVNDSERVEETV